MDTQRPGRRHMDTLCVLLSTGTQRLGPVMGMQRRGLVSGMQRHGLDIGTQRLSRGWEQAGGRAVVS